MYAKLISAEPLDGRTLKLTLDTGDEVQILGTKKALRKAVAGGNYAGITVIYNTKLDMTKEDWQKIQPVLLAYDFGPMLNHQLTLTYEDLAKLPQRAWKGGLQDYGSGYQKLFLYYPVNLFRIRDGKLHGIIRETDFPVDGEMTLWRLWNFDLATGDHDLERMNPQTNEYF